MIKTVLLDLDNTIFDFSACERAALAETLRRHDIEPDDGILSLYSRINDAHWKMLERGELSADELNAQRFKVLLGELGQDISRAADIAVEYERTLSAYHIFMPGAKELLEKLVGKYRLVLATNGFEATQTRRIREAGIDKYFDEVIISQVVGCNKPAKGFFDYCFARLGGFLKSETVMVGDSLTSDMLGGINAGIRTIWLNMTGAEPADGIVPERIISVLTELPELLESM